MRRSILVTLPFALGLACTPPKSGQVQTSVANHKTTGAAVAWSPTLPCAVAVVGDPSHVETICCAPKAASSSEWSCTVTAAPPIVSSGTAPAKKPCVCPPGVPLCNC